MFKTTLYINEKEIKRRLGVLADMSGTVIARAVNRAYPTGKAAIAREAKKNYRLIQRDVNDDKVLKIKKAIKSRPTAFLTYTGKHRNLYLWDNGKAVSPNKVIHWSNGKPNVKVYKAAVMRGHGRIKLGGENKAFIQTVRKGEKSEFTGLFRRKGNGKEDPLVGVGAPAIPQILKNEKITDRFELEAWPMLEKRLEHEIDVILKGGTQ